METGGKTARQKTASTKTPTISSNREAMVKLEERDAQKQFMESFINHGKMFEFYCRRNRKPIIKKKKTTNLM